MKQAVIIYQNEKAVVVSEIKTFADSTEFLIAKQKAEKNYQEIVEKHETEKKALADKIHELEQSIVKLDAKLKLINGEIEEKEYEELCQNNGIN